MSSGTRKFVTILSCAGMVVVAARCSPKTASLSKDMVRQMEADRLPSPTPSHPVDNGGESPLPADHFTLRTHLLDDQAYLAMIQNLDASHYILRLNGDEAIPAHVAGLDNDFNPGTGVFNDFKDGAATVVLPSEVQPTASGGDAYLLVDLTDTQIQAPELASFQLTLQKMDGPPNSWKISTTPAPSTDSAHQVLSSVERVVIALPDPSAKPSPQPSAEPSSSPSSAPSSGSSGA